MAKICEICGKEIIYPNFVYNSSYSGFERFYECGLCTLDFHFEQYNEFKDCFPNTLSFHFEQLEQINSLNSELLSFK